MRVGISIFDTDRAPPPVELARAIEQRGFDGLFLPEHSHIPVSGRSRWPGSPPEKDVPLPDYYRRLHRYVHRLFQTARGIQSLKTLASNPSRLNRTLIRTAAATAYHAPAALIEKGRLKRLERA